MVAPVRLKKPRRIEVNPRTGLFVTRIYGDVKCGYCPFRGANHWRNFATEYNPKYGNKTPCCHACARGRRLVAIAREKLKIQVFAAESKARRSKVMLPVVKKATSRRQQRAQQATRRRLGIGVRVRRMIRSARG